MAQPEWSGPAECLSAKAFFNSDVKIEPSVVFSAAVSEFKWPMWYEVVRKETPSLLAQECLHIMKNKTPRILDIVSVILNSGLLNQVNNLKLFHLDMLKHILCYLPKNN